MRMMKKNRLLRRSKFYPEYDLDPQECVVCGRRDGEAREDEEEARVTIDRFYLPWCQWCNHRRRGIDWGERNNFPQLDLGFAKTFGPGIKCWHPVIFLQETNEDLIYALLAYIEVLEEMGA